MKQSQLWGLQRAGIICLNTYLILSLNFVAIFAHGSPDRIQDNIHSSNRQRYRDRHHNHSNRGGSDSAGSSAQGNNVNLWKSQSPSGYNHRTGTPSSYSFNSQNVGRSNPFENNRAYIDYKSNVLSNPKISDRLSERTLSSKRGEAQNIRLQARTNRNKKDRANKRISLSLLPRNSEVADTSSHLIPLQETGYSDAGDTIDLSKIRDESSFEIAVDDIQPSRLKVTKEELLENSIDRFDAFGDYEYIDADQYPKKVEFHSPLTKRPPDLRRIDDSVYDPYWWERGRPTRPTTVRRVDNPYSPRIRFPRPANRPNGHRRQNHIQPHPNHNYNPQGQTFQDTFSYHNPLTKIPASHFKPTAAPTIFGSIFNLVGLNEKSSNAEYRPNPAPSRPKPSKGGIFSFLFGSKKDDVQYPDYYDAYDPPYGQPGYTDYDYGDYNEGVGLFPPKKLTVSQRVSKWFSGFKIPSTKRRSYILGGSRRPGERVTIGGQHPLDYDYYDSGDDHNLIFYGQQNNIGQRPPSSGGAGLGSDDFDFTEVTDAIKNNNTGVEIAKKVLSKLAKLTERSGDSNSLFMMWTIPTTLLAIMGIIYFVGALVIVSYKYSLFFNGDPNQAVNLIPVAIAFSLPLIIGIVLVSGRASLNGQLDVGRVMKGDFERSMRSDFDGVDFTLDGVFGSFGLLGLAWLASVTL